MMKVLVLAVVLLLALTLTEGLECHHCVSKKPGGPCSTTVENCVNGKNACARVKFLTSPYSQFQRCMKMSDCHMLKMNSYIEATCCSTALCNE